MIRTSRRLTGALFAVGATLAAVTAGSDPAGQLLAAPAAVAALLMAGYELAAGPLLAADREGVRLRSGVRLVTAAWPSVVRMRATRERRADLLELDLGTTVVLLSGLRLGRPPAEVVADLLAVRQAAASGEHGRPDHDRDQ